MIISKEESWKSAQILEKTWWFHNFLSKKCDNFLEFFSKTFFDDVSCDILKIAKWRKLTTKKITDVTLLLGSSFDHNKSFF
jgi:hypothetical protein